MSSVPEQPAHDYWASAPKVYFKSGVLESLEERRALVTLGFKSSCLKSCLSAAKKLRLSPGCKRRQWSLAPS